MNRFELGFFIKQILATIYKKIDLAKIFLILNTNSYFQYQCLVQLGITKEKQLIDNIILFKHLYEKKKIYEIRWIYGKDSLINAITKIL